MQALLWVPQLLEHTSILAPTDRSLVFLCPRILQYLERKKNSFNSLEKMKMFIPNLYLEQIYCLPGEVESRARQAEEKFEDVNEKLHYTLIRNKELEKELEETLMKFREKESEEEEDGGERGEEEEEEESRPVESSSKSLKKGLPNKSTNPPDFEMNSAEYRFSRSSTSWMVQLVGQEQSNEEERTSLAIQTQPPGYGMQSLGQNDLLGLPDTGESKLLSFSTTFYCSIPATHTSVLGVAGSLIFAPHWQPDGGYEGHSLPVALALRELALIMAGPPALAQS
ncbi:hypothetical protein MC885_018555 [Smutsia gigantea]|nr:hypothetical protein MC885_018555 [Smutsia gigantea]